MQGRAKFASIASRPSSLPRRGSTQRDTVGQSNADGHSRDRIARKASCSIKRDGLMTFTLSLPPVLLCWPVEVLCLRLFARRRPVRAYPPAISSRRLHGGRGRRRQPFHRTTHVASGLLRDGAPPSASLRRRIAFETNDGQTDEQVRFLARGNGHSVFPLPPKRSSRSEPARKRQDNDDPESNARHTDRSPSAAVMRIRL